MERLPKIRSIHEYLIANKMSTPLNLDHFKMNEILKILNDTIIWRIDSLIQCKFSCLFIGISRDSFHKRRATGGKRKQLRKKRKFESGRPAANTKVSFKRKREEVYFKYYFLLMLKHASIVMMITACQRINHWREIPFIWISSTDKKLREKKLTSICDLSTCKILKVPLN